MRQAIYPDRLFPLTVQWHDSRCVVMTSKKKSTPIWTVSEPETGNVAKGRSGNRKKVAAVIPAYNEVETIADIVDRVLDQLDEVIVVDDGSEDGTAEALSQLPVKILRNKENCGKGGSILRGSRYAIECGAEAVITLDGDSQHRPEDIPHFLAMAERFPESIIIGSRLGHKEGFPLRRYYANRIANFWISWAAGYYIEDSQSGFRLYPRSILQHPRITKMRGPGFVFESEILIEAARLGCGSKAVPIEAIYAKHARRSHFRPIADISHIVLMVACKLLFRGMYPSGFYRAFIRPS